LWDKFEVVGKYSTKDFDKPWEAREEAVKSLRKARKNG
jgi:predicted DNA-binding WGR domain protein